MPRFEKTTSFDFERERSQIKRNFSVMVKPVGPVCNLDCDYCYYIDKEVLYPGKEFNVSSFRMRDAVLEVLIKDYIQLQESSKIEFVWHGGEPTLLGIDYFKKIIAFQRLYAGGREISNALQTNGTLINDEWASFLAENRFLCGLSIDGPQKVHDHHRQTPGGKGSWEKATECARLFKKHGVEFNIMSVVNAANGRQPAQTYSFLKELGSQYLQFSPVVERIAIDNPEGLSIVNNDYEQKAVLMEEGVEPLDWGNFLCRVFDIWVKTDVGSVYVNYFDNTLAGHVGQRPALCSMAPDCGCSLAIEHNGDVYCCDHFVFPEYQLGNLLKSPLSEIVKKDKQLLFEQRKQDDLSKMCKACEFLNLCGGDCPKNRFVKNQEDEYISYLCSGFKKYFSYTKKYFEFMAAELVAGRPPANIMDKKL